jgi:glycosyltransferase involved in cell wall biosynthesis
MLPVSIIACTYGRARCLSELLECYLQQIYTGPSELMVLNDFGGQVFMASGLERLKPNQQVNFINEPDRYPSLGDKRNAAVERASYEHFLFVDDDDLFLPWYLNTTITAYEAWGLPTWPTSHYFASGRAEKLTMSLKRSSHPASYMMSKAQFAQIGRYPFVYAGGDQMLRTKVHKEFSCEAAKNPTKVEAGYIYRWNNNVYHISGSSQHDTAWIRTEQSLLRRIKSKQEPTGIVTVQPSWESDYKAIADDALARSGHDRQ